MCSSDLADRIFTPPADFSPKLVMETGEGVHEITVEPDDQFYRSLQVFARCVLESHFQQQRYEDILQQIELVTQLEQIK